MQVQEEVLISYPFAHCERYGDAQFCIKEKRGWPGILGYAETEEKAWKNALEKVMSRKGAGRKGSATPVVS